MRPLEDFAILTDLSGKKKMVSDSFPESDLRVIFLCGTSVQAQYYILQLKVTDTSITPGTLLTIISSVTKHMQLCSKRKVQYSYHFENNTTLLGV